MTTITVYTTGPACMQCTLTKITLARAGLGFQEIDVRHSPEALDYIQRELGYTQSPVVVINDEDHWSGFQPDQIHRIATTMTHSA